MRKVIIVAALVGVLVSGPAVAASEQKTIETVQQLLPVCKRVPPAISCSAMMQGVFGALVYDPPGNAKPQVCIRGFTSTGQAIQIFINWAERNPMLWQLLAPFGMAEALIEALPCKK